MTQLLRLAPYLLIAASVGLAVAVGADSKWWNSGSDLLLVAFGPAFFAGVIWGVRESAKSERKRKLGWDLPFPYKRDLGGLFVEGMIAPVFVGIFVSIVAVLVIALVTHAIVTA